MHKGPNKRAGETGHNVRPFGSIDDDLKERYLLLVSHTGQLTSSARMLGVSAQTMITHRKDDPEFDNSVKEAVELYRDRIDEEIRRRGIEGYDEPVFYQGRVVGWVRKYSDQLAIAHAKAHDPRYRDKVEATVHHTGVMVVPETSTPEEWANRFSAVN